MAAIAAERDMLLARLALQSGLIDQVRAVAALQTWTGDRAPALAEHLAAHGDLDRRASVEALVRSRVPRPATAASARR